VIGVEAAEPKDPERKDKKRLDGVKPAAVYSLWPTLTVIKDDGDGERVKW